MSDDSPPFNVIQGEFGKRPGGKVGEIASPRPPPGANLSTQERRVWEYICASLVAAGVEHVSAGLTIKVICRTYVDWLAELKRCDEEGRYGRSGNGNAYELPHSYTEKQLKRDLLKWLPEACLTIPSLVAARAKLGDNGLQDDLFADLVAHATEPRGSYSRA
ncbi:hypothetical protein [Chitiniphilus eburneus]|uniref:hypothetical protein n=1 Tax=Chitiniphilus eburneus TaxID=2571148 RepID=UPI0035CFB681